MYECEKFHKNRRWCRQPLVELTWNDPIPTSGIGKHSIQIMDKNDMD